MIRKAARYPCAIFSSGFLKCFRVPLLTSQCGSFFPRQLFELAPLKCSSQFESHSAGEVQVGPHKRI